MDYKNIINLMKEMNHTDLTKLEIEEEGVRICIEKASKEAAASQTAVSYPAHTFAPGLYQAMPYAQPAAAPAPAQISSVTNAVGDTAAADAQIEDQNHKKIVSPMVGTFYAQSSPDKPPFVKVGDKVKKGQTICIIEAMKLMNEIESDHDGEIVKILTQNEQMVEYGQPLFLIK